MKQLLGMLRPTLLVVLSLTCNSDYHFPGNSHQEKDCHELEPGDKGFLQLAKSDEPGEPLVIYGKIIDRKTLQPVPDASLFLYQTDSSGIYHPSGGPDHQARISGTVATHESGCFKIKTILPGDYPGRKNSRHLHYVINAKGYQAVRSILFFRGFTTPNITDGGPLRVLAIQKEKNGTWTGSIDLYMDAAQGAKD